MKKFMKMKALVAFFVMVAVALVIPASHATPLTATSHDYKNGGNSLSFNGNIATMQIGSQKMNQKWTVETWVNGTLVHEKLTLNQTYTESNGPLYSVIRQYQAPNLIVSEIYSFMGNGIDQAILIKNYAHTNKTFLTFYQASQNGVQSILTHGLLNNNNAISGSANGIHFLSGSVLSIHTGHSSLSWNNAESAYRGGTLTVSNGQYGLSVAFATNALTYGAAYTIDPYFQEFPVKSSPSLSSSQIWDYISGYGTFLEGVVGASFNGNSDPVSGTTAFLTQTGAQYEQNPNAPFGSGVNKITQTLTMTGNSANVADSISFYIENDLYQNHDTNTVSQTSTILSTLTAIANTVLSAYGIPLSVLNPMAFINHDSVNNYYTNTVSRTYNAGSTYSGLLGYTTYQTLFYRYDLIFTKTSYMFGWTMNTAFTHHQYSFTQSNPLTDYFSYEVALSASTGQPNDVSSTTLFLTFDMGHYN